MTFDEFVRLKQVSLLRFGTVLTGDPRLGEEVVQAVLVRAYERWSEIGEMDYVSAYIRRMIVNDFLSWRRKFARIEPFDAFKHDRNVADHAENHAERDAVLLELAKLPKRQRAVLVLRYYDDLSDTEIAEVLGCSAGTVRGYASRALSTLRIAAPPTQSSSMAEGVTT
ncbi:SigE family RNA polymerase sigma factor [Jatrophihabitans sp. DSM 45814]